MCFQLVRCPGVSSPENCDTLSWRRGPWVSVFEFMWICIFFSWWRWYYLFFFKKMEGMKKYNWLCGKCENRFQFLWIGYVRWFSVVMDVSGCWIFIFCPILYFLFLVGSNSFFFSPVIRMCCSRSFVVVRFLFFVFFHIYFFWLVRILGVFLYLLFIFWRRLRVIMY